MISGQTPTPPPVFDRDPKALRAHAEQNHRNALGLNEDLGHIGGWIWSAVRWPFRLLARVVRRDRQSPE